MQNNSLAIVDPGLSFAGLSRRTSTSHFIIHHAAADSLTVQQIHNLHRKQGWSGVGYNFYITKDGVIYKGRGWEYIGAHTVDYNSRSIGICFEGNYETSSSVPSAQLTSGMLLLAEALYLYPSLTIIGGHKSFNATACPGHYFPLDRVIAGGKAVKAADDTGASLDNVLQGYLTGISSEPAGTECPYAEPSAYVRKGSKGEAVSWVQWHLNRHGANLTLDGDFGALTDTALRSFQKNNTLAADGIVGPLTRTKLKQ